LIASGRVVEVAILLIGALIVAIARSEQLVAEEKSAACIVTFG